MTVATPAAMSASQHGPVRPRCAQGSSVTRTVEPRARSPAARSALISACASPQLRCAPSAMIVPVESVMMQPTIGFGSTRPCPREASRTAASSNSEIREGVNDSPRQTLCWGKSHPARGRPPEVRPPLKCASTRRYRSSRSEWSAERRQ